MPRRLGRHDHAVGRSRSRGCFAVRVVGGGLNLVAGGFGRRRSPVPRESRDAVGVGGCRLNGDELTLVATQPVHRSHRRKLQTSPRLPRRSESARAQCTLQPSPRVLLRPRGVHRAFVGVRGVPRGALDERVALVGGHVTAQTDGCDGVSRRLLLALARTPAPPLPGRDVEGLDRERVVAGLGREVLRLLEQPLLGVNLPAHGRLAYSQRRPLAVHASRGPAPAADVVGVQQPAHRDVVQGLVSIRGVVLVVAVDADAPGVVLQLPRRQVKRTQYSVQVSLQILRHRHLPRAKRRVHRPPVHPAIPSPKIGVEDAVEVADAALHPDVIVPGGPPRLHRERGRHLLEVRPDERDRLLVRGQLRHLPPREVLAVRRRVRVGDARQRLQDGVSILTNRQRHRVPRGLRRIVRDLPPPGDVADLHVRLAHPQHGDRPGRLERRQ